MRVLDVLNTRPPELLASWLDALGTFDQLTPHDAAARWGVPVREAMERLHAMVGGPLEIPAGSIETYRRAEWAPDAIVDQDTGKPMHERDAQRVRRLAMIPKGGATRVELIKLWGVSGDSAFYEIVRVMQSRGLIRLDRSMRPPVWRRT